MRVEHEYARKGAWAYLAAWDVHRARIFGRCEDKTGIAPFERLVRQVMSREPYRSAARVFWVVDNGSSHRGERCQQRLARRWPDAEPSHVVFRSHDGARVLASTFLYATETPAWRVTLRFALAVFVTAILGAFAVTGLAALAWAASTYFALRIGVGNYGVRTTDTLGAWIASLIAPILSVAALAAAVLSYRDARPLRFFNLLAALGATGVAAYLWSWGVFGIRTF
jgi:hypothetical protein